MIAHLLILTLHLVRGDDITLNQCNGTIEIPTDFNSNLTVICDDVENGMTFQD